MTMNNTAAAASQRVTLVTIAGSELSPTWERAAQDVCSVFDQPEHQAHEESVETMMLMMSCSAKSREAYADAVAVARIRGLLARPKVPVRLEGGSYARCC